MHTNNKILLEAYLKMLGQSEKYPRGDVREYVKSRGYDERFIDWFKEVYAKRYFSEILQTLQEWWDYVTNITPAGFNHPGENIEYRLGFALKKLDILYLIYCKDFEWISKRMEREKLQKRINQASKEVGVDLDI